MRLVGLFLAFGLAACGSRLPPPDELIPLPLIQRPVEPILIPLYEPEPEDDPVLDT